MPRTFNGSGASRNLRTSGRPLLLSLIAVAAVALAGCSKKSEPTAPPVTPATDRGTPVEVRTATNGTVTHWVSVTGSLVSLQDVPLSARAAGRLAEVYVREGDTVTAGQVIARLDMSDQESQVRSAEAAVAAARARVAQSEASYRQQLVSSQTVLQSAEAVYKWQQTTTTTGIQSAEAAVQAAQANLSQVKEGARSQDVRRAETQVAIAQANLNKASSDVRRYRTLAKEGAVAQSTLEQYETTEQVLKEQLRSAQEALSLVKEGARSQEVVQAEQQVRQAQEQLRQARAAVSQNEVKRADVASARAAQAQNEVRKADVLAARATLQQAESTLAIARKALVDASVISPISGQVSSRTADPGQVLAAGAPILRVVSLNSVYFEPSVPDREIGFVQAGKRVEVTLSAFPNRKFIGQVTKIYPAGSQQSRAFPVRITIQNPDGALRPQMFAQGRIEAEQKSGVVLIPRDALIRSDNRAEAANRARVFTVESGIAKEHTVVLGLTSEDGTRIQADGILAGTQVIVSGQRGLADGDAVAAKPAGESIASTH